MDSNMREQLEQRLQELRAEFERGQQMLAELEEKRDTMRESMLRISGAIQVLEEELRKAYQAEQNGGEVEIPSESELSRDE
jgi:chromosome segregation ATPase